MWQPAPITAAILVFVKSCAVLQPTMRDLLMAVKFVSSGKRRSQEQTSLVQGRPTSASVSCGKKPQPAASAELATSETKLTPAACYHSVPNLLFAHLLSRNVKIKTHRTMTEPVSLYECETRSVALGGKIMKTEDV